MSLSQSSAISPDHTMCDPHIVPGHMLDIILHQDAHQVICDMPDDDLDDEKTMNDEAHGVLKSISRETSFVLRMIVVLEVLVVINMFLCLKTRT